MMGSSALTLSTGGCGVVARGTYKAFAEIRNSELWYQGRHGKLTETELGWAKIAWKYFENNCGKTIPATGKLPQHFRYLPRITSIRKVCKLARPRWYITFGGRKGFMPLRWQNKGYRPMI